MRLDYDPAKNERNIRERGLPFELVDHFAWETAETHEDTRFVYPEPRFVSSGLIGGRVFVVCFTPDPGRYPCDQFSQGQCKGGGKI